MSNSGANFEGLLPSGTVIGPNLAGHEAGQGLENLLGTGEKVKWLMPETFMAALGIKEGSDSSAAFVAMTEYIRKEAAASNYIHFRIILRGSYILNGVPITTLGGNSIWPMGNHGDTAARVDIVCGPGLTTFTTGRTSDVDSAEHGPPSIIGGPTDEQMGKTSNFSAWTVRIYGELQTIAPNNPKIAGQNWSRVNVFYDQISDRTVSFESTEPTSPYAFGIYLPGGDNNGSVCGLEPESKGRYVGIVLPPAHTTFQKATNNYCLISYGLVGNDQFQGNDGHSASSMTLLSQECAYGLAGWSPREQTIKNLAGEEHLMVAGLNSLPIGCPWVASGAISLDFEDGAAGHWYSKKYHVYDLNNQIYVKGRYGRVIANVGPVSGPLTKLGGENAKLEDATIPPASGTASELPSKRLETSDQIRSMLTNQGSPTVLVLGGTLASSVKTAWNATGAPFQIQGVNTIREVTLGGSAYAGVTNGPTNSPANTIRWAFDVECEQLVLDLYTIATGGQVRVWVDECPSSWLSLPESEAARSVLVKLQTRGYHRIVVEGSGNKSSTNEGSGELFFGGVNMLEADTLWPPSSNTLRIAHEADSYGEGIGAERFSLNHINTLDRTLGVAQSTNLSRGGTGFVSTINTPKYGEEPRLAELIATSADIICIHGSINDSSHAIGTTSGPIYEAAVKEIEAIRSALPNSVIVLFDVARPRAATSEDLLNHAELKLAAEATQIIFIDAQTTPWFTGTGSVQSPTGNGTADHYYNGSGAASAHPTQDGHNALGKRKGRELSLALKLPITFSTYDYSGAAIQAAMVSAPLLRPGSGFYYQGNIGLATGTFSTGVLRLTPVYIGASCNIEALFMEFTVAGEASGIFIPALYADNGSGYPGYLVTEGPSISTGTGNAGVVSTTGVPGVYATTVSASINPGLYWIGGVPQSTVAATLRQATFTAAPLGTSGLPSTGSSVNLGYAQTGVTSTLPIVFTKTVGLSATTPRIGFRAE
jgi:hypothetical protein